MPSTPDKETLLRALNALQERIAIMDAEGRVLYASPALLLACGRDLESESTLAELLGYTQPLPRYGQVSAAARRPDGDFWRAELMLEPLGELTLARQRPSSGAPDADMILSIRRFAHDFNNDLQTISIHIELLNRWARSSPGAQEDLAIMQESVRRSCQRAASLQALLRRARAQNAAVVVLEEDANMLRVISRILNHPEREVVETSSLAQALVKLQGLSQAPVLAVVSNQSTDEALKQIAAMKRVHSDMQILLCLATPPPPRSEWATLGIGAVLSRSYNPHDLITAVEDLVAHI